MAAHTRSPKVQGTDSSERAFIRERFYVRMFYHSFLVGMFALGVAVIGAVIGIFLKFLGSESSANLPFMGIGKFIESFSNSVANAAFISAAAGGALALVGLLFLAFALWKTKES